MNSDRGIVEKGNSNSTNDNIVECLRQLPFNRNTLNLGEYFTTENRHLTIQFVGTDDKWRRIQRSQRTK